MNPILSVSTAVQLHTPQKSPKIASSVCFDSAHRRIIPNMIVRSLPNALAVLPGL